MYIALLLWSHLRFWKIFSTGNIGRHTRNLCKSHQEVKPEICTIN
jgi:hypothetical protein